MLGQAAGIGAALAVAGDTDVTGIDPLEVRRVVEQRGAHLAVAAAPAPPR